MPKAKKSQNRHPVDRLFDIREQLKALEAEEKALRADILESGNVNGDEHVAMVKESVRKLLDRPELERRFGVKEVAECCKESAVTTLTIYKKTVDVFD